MIPLSVLASIPEPQVLPMVPSSLQPCLLVGGYYTTFYHFQFKPSVSWDLSVYSFSGAVYTSKSNPLVGLYIPSVKNTSIYFVMVIFIICIASIERIPNLRWIWCSFSFLGLNLVASSRSIGGRCFFTQYMECTYSNNSLSRSSAESVK